MKHKTALWLWSIPFTLIACGSQADSQSAAPGEGTAELGGIADNPGLHPVAATTKTPGVWSPDALSVELAALPQAVGANPFENPATVTLADTSTTVTIGYYGYGGPGPLLPAAGDLPSATHLVEATKSEPDKNTYLVLDNQTGPDASYNYGTHFLFQGHENGPSGVGSISRINLDADPAHRVTLFATADSTGKPLKVIDGSTWDPFAQRLLFTTENPGAPTYQSTLSFPPVVEDISGSLGRGGYEGIQDDLVGNVWIVEDQGGSKGAVNKHSKQPNSFIYRFVPDHIGSLNSGSLQVLQVTSLRTGTPIAFHAGAVDGDILSPDVKDLHTYGKSFATRWVTIHDTTVDGSTPFDANALGKAAQGTPFKRPENGMFRPGVNNTQFFFTETGDTDATTEAGAAYGGFGGVFKLTQGAPGDDTGTLSIFYVSDVAHTGFDNLAFWGKNFLAVVEDAGDTLHTQRNALDSGYIFDVTAKYGDPINQPLRFLGEGRDPSATLDSGFSGLAGFQNEGDNEITGIHVSDGDPTVGGVLGGRVPKPFHAGWRVFYTAQHGDNVTSEIIPRPGFARQGED